MTDLEELACRVEKLTEPDREVDVEIWRGLAYATPGYHPSDYDKALAYTDSLDAAMSLVPEGWSVCVVRGPFDGAADVSPDFAESRPVSARAKTPALALTAAALRARARSMEADHE